MERCTLRYICGSPRRLFGRKARGGDEGRAWLPTGWRRLAIFNVVLMLVSSLVLVGVLAAAVTNGGGLARSWDLYVTPDCGKAAVANTWLHLLINALSTVVIASSNFFMQVLNAPSRREVDTTHARGSWLDIGVPSWRNAFRLSIFKLVAWLVLFATSLSIHVLFNSSVFQMERRMDDFHVTIAAESFFHGSSYFMPGASMITDEMLHDVTVYGSGYGLLPKFQILSGAENSSLHEATDAARTAAQDPRWKRLDTDACLALYSSQDCAGLRDYRNLVIVVEGPGWRRPDIWSLHPSAEALWEPIVPREKLNALWLSTQCSMKGIVRGYTAMCMNDCANISRVYESGLTVFRYPEKMNWNSSVYSATGTTAPDFRVRPVQSASRMLHCFAEARDTGCTVAVSKALILAVIVSIAVKAVTCAITILVLGSEEPLVTPGDAIASFISVQDRTASVPGLVSQHFIRMRKQGFRERGVKIYESLEPKPWTRKHHRKVSGSPSDVWVLTYIFLAAGLIGTIVCLVFQTESGISLKWFKPNASKTTNVLTASSNGNPFIFSVIVANLPQLYLSFCHFSCNALITRLEMSWEWAMFSIGYHPLRVTQPRGHQVSTYRLQLPYKLSIPLMAFSTLTHWVLSNAIFIVVSQGTYYVRQDGIRSHWEPEWGVGKGYQSDPANLPDDASIVIGTSSLPVLLLAILLIAMMVFPFALAWRPLPGYMPIVGSNSLAMAAACRVSPLAKVPQHLASGSDGEGVELEELIPSTSEDARLESGDNSEGPKDLALHPLKWGEVEMPEEWYLEEGGNGAGSERMGHLSFGTVLDDPQPPTEGRLYR